MVTAEEVRKIVEEAIEKRVREIVREEVEPIKRQVEELQANMLTEERVREIVREEVEPLKEEIGSLKERVKFVEISFSTLSAGIRALQTHQDEAFDVNPIYGYTGRGFNNTKLEQKTPW